ncbi:hypothetical protein ACOXXX_17705 [Thalassococcus sp. BH17M4-6]|uniref:hypothetical protein n=1 Tax=Thalassococcus sp. BH17M4-6 TaxID=3413148 RepID=UPI003BED4594
MKPDRQLTIPDSPPDRVTLNFAKLLKDGIEAAQELSHDVWTDYNEHDPGVTMLEALCYGLTDMAYRTDHPVADILSSSAKVTGVPMRDQPLITGDRMLTNAPLTEMDFRKLAYDEVRGLRNLWLDPVPKDSAGFDGLLRVYVQAYPQPPDTRPASIAPQSDHVDFLGRVQRLLESNRNLGQDFARIAMVHEVPHKLKVTLTVEPDKSTETVLSHLLYRVQNRMNPAPVLREVSADMAAGVPPTTIFQGPRLSHGWIADDSLAPLDASIRFDAILDAIAQTPGVGDVGRLEVVPVTALRAVDPAGDPVPSINVLSRDIGDLKSIVVIRDGVPQSPNLERVLSQWHHLQEQARWHAGYATAKTDDLAYTRVPQGNPNRQLGRYRSIQHLFPGVYNLAEQGPPMNVVSAYQRDIGDAAARSGLRKQLKAYLLFFEQLMTDYLAQLEHTSVLLSFAEQDRTYYTQPLLVLDRPDPGAPPDIAKVLGKGTVPDSKGPDTWYTDYLAGLNHLRAESDPVQLRINRTLSAFLARFNEPFPDRRLRRIPAPDPGPCPVQPFEEQLAAQKRSFLRQIGPLTYSRGTGVNLAMPAVTEMEKAVRAKTGHRGRLAVIEHLLLRPQSDHDLIPYLEIDKTFRIERDPPVRAVRLATDRFQVALVLDLSDDRAAWPQLAARIARLGADPENYSRSPRGGYTVRVRLRAGAGESAEVLEGFPSHHAAKAAIREMVILCQDIVDGRCPVDALLTPVLVPLDFCQQRVSVFLDLDPHDPGGREYVNLLEDIIAEQMPAHLTHDCYWLRSHREQHRLRHLRAHWMAALGPLAMTPDPTPAQKLAVTRAARPLRLFIQRYYVRGLLHERRHARRLALLQDAGRR